MGYVRELIRDGTRSVLYAIAHPGMPGNRPSARVPG
jgi:hypothetical protein